ncbi:MAG: TorF family putative porin [Rubrivivax sp.]|nr:TorF family putative porin [Rubrivivax sp.]
MKVSLSAAAVAVALSSLALPQVAQADVAFNIGAVSDYRYRGISQSRLKPAVQGGLDWSHASGFYLGAWASTIKWIEDAGGKADYELDLYGGWKGEVTKGLTLDVGLLAYQYPGHKAVVSPNTTEVYGALSFGPATLKYSHSTTNLFGFSNSKNSSYIDLSASFTPMDGLTLTPHVGYQKVAKNGDFSYTDYSLTAAYEVAKGLTISGMVVGTSTKSIAGTKAYASPKNGKDLGKAGVVFGVKYAF